MLEMSLHTSDLLTHDIQLVRLQVRDQHLLLNSLDYRLRKELLAIGLLAALAKLVRLQVEK